MNIRRAKQIIYGALYIIVWVGVITGAYFLFFRTAPSCFDNIQNEGETGVDCGGPCSKVCIPSDLQGISVLNVSAFASSPGHYTVLAEVANTNNGFAAQSFDYHFSFYDASGTLLQSVPGQSFMYSGEVKYLILPNFVSSTTVDHAGLVLGTANWVSAAAMGAVPDLVVQSLGAGPTTSSTISVNGQIANQDISAFTNILVVAVFKGSDGTVLGASQTEIDSLVPNATQNFSVIYPANPAIDPALTQFYAYAVRP